MGLDQNIYKVSKKYFDIKNKILIVEKNLQKKIENLWQFFESKYKKIIKENFIKQNKEMFNNTETEKEIEEKVIFDILYFIGDYCVKKSINAKEILKYNMFNYFSVYNFDISEKDKEKLIKDIQNLIDKNQICQDKELISKIKEVIEIKKEINILKNLQEQEMEEIMYVSKCEDIHTIITKHFPYIKKYDLYILNPKIARKVLKKLNKITNEEDFEEIFDELVIRDYKFQNEIEKLKDILEKIVNHKEKKDIFIYQFF